MKKSCKVCIMPVYEYDELSEKQFKAVQIKMLDYPNAFNTDGIVISSYGGKKAFRKDFYFVMGVDSGVYHKEYFSVDRNDIETDDTLTKKLEGVLKYMDGIAKELEKIIEENEES